MKITKKLLPKYNDRCYYYHTPLGSGNDVILILFLLYHSDVITKKKFMGMLRQHEKGKLLRKIGTHHCSINDKWYNSEDYYNVLLEAFWDNGIRIKDMSFDDAIKYTNIYLNKPVNYCIDWFYHEMIKPFIDNMEYSEESINALKSLDIVGSDVCVTYE